MVLGQLDITCKRMKLNSYFMPYKKYLNINQTPKYKGQSYKTLRRKHRFKPLYPWISQQLFRWKVQDDFIYLLKISVLGQAWWLTHVIPALWEAEVVGSPEVRNSKTAWPAWWNTSAKNTKLARCCGWRL